MCCSELEFALVYSMHRYRTGGQGGAEPGEMEGRRRTILKLGFIQDTTRTLPFYLSSSEIIYGCFMSRTEAEKSKGASKQREK